MSNGSLDYILGQINAKLENNEKFHDELKIMVKDIQGKLDQACLDVTVLQTKAKTWGAVAGLVVGIAVNLLFNIFNWLIFKR